MLNIDRICELLKDENFLFGDMMAKFPKNNNTDQVRFWLDYYRKSQGLPKSVEVKLKKCEEKAVAPRKIGNRLYVEKNYLEALKAYNESLCWAPIGSESLGIAYANRSAIYLKCGFFKFCLENIELAMENNYPERLKQKLVTRKEECLEKMKTAKYSTEKFDYKHLTKLTYPANPKIPFMIEGLQLKQNAKYGRLIVAKRDLKIGDIVMIEEPFDKSYDKKEDAYSNCFYCCENNFLNLKPCSKTRRVMFCTEKCSKDAWNEFYQYMWPIIDGIMENELLFNCRAAIKSFFLFDDPLKLKELIDSAKTDPITVFDVDMSIADEITKFKIMFSLVAKKSSISLLLQEITRKTSLVFYMLKEFTDFKKFVHSQELEDLFLEIFVQFQWMRNCNSHAVFDRLESYDILEKCCFSGIFLGSALLNHSCIANTHRLSAFGKLYLAIARPVKAGEQLFDNYGTTPTKHTREERQNMLKEPYHFVCDCEACTFEIHHTFEAYPKNFIINFPETANFLRNMANPMCPYDEPFLVLSSKAKKELVKYIGKNKILSKEFVDFVFVLSKCLWIEILKQPLPIILSQ